MKEAAKGQRWLMVIKYVDLVKRDETMTLVYRTN